MWFSGIFVFIIVLCVFRFVVDVDVGVYCVGIWWCGVNECKYGVDLFYLFLVLFGMRYGN